jgi:superfamily II DNA/RNA helicase
MKLQEQIVIGTPGTMLDWCIKFKFIDPKMIKVFVLDEADVMIATQGHQDQSIRIQRSRTPFSVLQTALPFITWMLRPKLTNVDIYLKLQI